MNTQLLKSGAGEERLRILIEQRLAPGADKEKIDAQIWDLFGEEWSVMFTDLSGFSRNVAKFGIIHFLVTIHEAERLLMPVIQDNGGFLLKVEGDSFLVIFRKPRNALECAVRMQKALEGYNADKQPEDKVLLCVGLGHGSMLRIGDSDVFGSEVNAASKLGEDTAKATEILVTDSFRSKIMETAGGSWEALDEAPPGAAKAWKYKY